MIWKSFFCTVIIWLCLCSQALFAQSVPSLRFGALNEGQSAVSLIWNLPTDSLQQSREAQAIAWAKLNSGTGDLNPRAVANFLTINNVDIDVNATGRHLIVTLQTPSDNYLKVMDFFNQLWRNTNINQQWFKRHLHHTQPRKQARFRQPEEIANALANYTQYGHKQADLDVSTTLARINSQPDLIIVNSRDDIPEQLTQIAIHDLPTANPKTPLPAQPIRPLPSGVIYLPDPDASETMIFIGEAKQLTDDNAKAIAETIYKYIGYGPGSEMFRIVRQQERAAYDPTSHFERIYKDWFLMGVSATVPANDWPRIYSIISDIYNSARDGNSTAQGLSDSKNNMLGTTLYKLRNDAAWLAARVLELHPNGLPDGQINLSEIDAQFNLDPAKINPSAIDIMAPMQDLLIIIMGGDTPPDTILDAENYCILDIDDWIDTCLAELND